MERKHLRKSTVFTQTILTIILSMVMVLSNMGATGFVVLGEETPVETPEVVEETKEETEEVVEETVEEVIPQEESVIKEEIPAPFHQEVVIDNIVITVEAEEGVFPVGSYLSVEKVPTNIEANVTEAIDQVRKEDTNVAVSYTFDIKVFDKENNVIQPLDNSKVKVLFQLAEVDNTNLETQVYHVTEEDLKVEELTVETEGDVAVVETEGFSIYTVEFTYNNLTYVMKGDSEVLLSDVLSYVGLNGEVSAVEVSNEELFAAVQKDGVWMVEARQPFTSNEWMKVTIDGITYEIVVTDLIGDGRWGEAYWWIDDDGTLNIRALNGASSPAIVSGTAPWGSFKNQIKKVVFTKGTSGYGVKVGVNVSLANLFNGYTNLTSVEGLSASDVDVEGKPLFDTTNATSMNGMFRDCSQLKELDLSGLVNNGKIYEMQHMFRDCSSLEKVILNNPNFISRSSPDGTSGGIQMQNMFDGCTSLQSVDMSNITIYGRNNWTQFQNMFKNNTSLEEIHLKNTKVPYCSDFTSMFEGCSNLKTVDLENFSPNDAVYMTNMFKDCTSLEELDVSSFGKLDNIVNMDGFVEGDTSLKTLNIDNLDNSNIGPTNTRHSITESDTHLKGAQEYGRMLGLHTCTALETLFANNSKVWVVNNNKGLPGNEYFDAANDSSIYYFTDKAMEFKSDAGPTVNIASDRDYIDIMTDRDGTSENTPALDGPSDIGDRGTNINIVNGDLNTNGPGFLAPGVYTLSGSRSNPDGPEMPKTYYRIAYLHESDFTIEGVDTFSDLVLTDGATTKFVNTDNITWPASGNVEMNGNMVITFKDAAIDVNGKLHDVKVTITKIVFKDLEKIPTESSSRGPHDQNNYVPDTREYYRNVLTLTKGDGLRFHNYVREGDPSAPWDDPKALSGGSGTNIEFTVEIADANANTTFIFKGEDLDVSEFQDWIKPRPEDPCYDNLPISNVTYGKGGESFILKDGNDLGTVAFADKTGLVKVDNQVVATGSDPSTSWSEFIVKADATGSKYTWVSGNACDSYALRDTPTLDTGSIKIQAQGTKEYVDSHGRTKTLKGGDFIFKMEEVSVDPSAAPKPTVPSDVTNLADGTFTFSEMEFKTTSESSAIYDSDTTPYFPGTDPSGNTNGNGKHNKITYTYKVTEVDGGDSLIDYDSSEHELKIVITTPEDDDEMEKGIKAEIYVNGTLEKTVWTKDVSNPIALSKLLFKNTFKGQDLTITKKTVTDKDGDFNFKVAIDYNGTPYELAASDIPDNVTYDSQTKEYTFTLKKDKSVTLKNLPVGSTYSIVEDRQQGWVLDEKENDSGTIVEDEDVTATFTNRPSYKLTIEKVVKGNAADTDKEFDFTVSFEKNGAAYVPPELPRDAQGSGGTYTFNLKGSEAITFVNIPHGVEYTVTEADYSREHYVTTIDGVKTSEVTGTLEEAKTITVTNTCETFSIKYLDGDHGKSDGAGDEEGKYAGEYPSGGNTVTPNKGYTFTGTYTYVIKDNEGNIIGTGSTNDPTTIEIKGNIEFTPVYKANATPTPKPTVKPTNKPYVPVPNTGDTFHVWTYMVILIGALFTALFGLRKLKNNRI